MAERKNTKYWIGGYPKINTNIAGAEAAADLYDPSDPEGEEQVVANSEGAKHLARFVQPMGGVNWSGNSDLKSKWDAFISQTGSSPTFTSTFTSTVVKDLTQNLGDGTINTQGTMTALADTWDGTVADNYEDNISTQNAVINALRSTILDLIDEVGEIKTILISHGIIAEAKEL